MEVKGAGSSGPLAYPRRCLSQPGSEIGHRGPGRGRARDEHQIHRGQLRKLQPHCFPQASLDPVAHHRASHLRRDRQPHPRPPAPPPFDETPSPPRAPPARDATSRARKLAASGPSAKLRPPCFTAANSALRKRRAVLGKPQAATGRPPPLLLGRADNEALAALRAASLQDVAARLGGVALAKAVLAVAADLARLVRALHDDCLLRAKSAARNHAATCKSRKAAVSRPGSATLVYCRPRRSRGAAR